MTNSTIVEITKNRPGGLFDQLQVVVGIFMAVLGAGMFWDLPGALLVGGLIAYADIRIDDLMQAICLPRK